jgi:hypothetical protein
MVPLDAARALSLTRRRYDLIYHQNWVSGHTTRFREHSFEWFERLARHAASGGAVVVDVPLRGLNAEAVRVIASTFEQATGAHARWRLVMGDGSPLMRLHTTPSQQHKANSASDGTWSPVEALLAEDPDVRRHTLRRDRISGLLGPDRGTMSTDLLTWLRGHQ